MKSAYDVTKISVRWDRTDFDKMLRGFSEERRAGDAQEIDWLFSLAALSPTARQALEWAKAHDVRFFVDRMATGAGGYYATGAGVVGIAESSLNDGFYGVSALVHEIRHAWQDAHGLIASPSCDFTTYSIQKALIEADAFAFELLVMNELRLGQEQASLRQRSNSLSAYEALELRESFARQKAAIDDKEGFLAQGFSFWFDSPRAACYGAAIACRFAAMFGMASVPPDVVSVPWGGFELVNGASRIPKDGIDITDPQRLAMLGKTFAGGSYFKQLPRDFLSREAVRPSLALTFYNAANGNQKKLTQAIRKESLKEKAFLRRQPRQESR